ncbi:MAG: hypothetical protein QMD66_06780 [Actinomycetota bacterium]|nr:hypothetical protein [Actinomycetota bacterium]
MRGANNYHEIAALREVEEQIMDVVAKAREILARQATVEELRAAYLDINKRQAAYQGKLEDIFLLHDQRHKEFQALFQRCRHLLEELEQAEDSIQNECFKLLFYDLKDAEAARLSAVGANRKLSGWIGRNLQALKSAFSRREAV